MALVVVHVFVQRLFRCLMLMCWHIPLPCVVSSAERKAKRDAERASNPDADSDDSDDDDSDDDIPLKQKAAAAAATKKPAGKKNKDEEGHTRTRGGGGVAQGMHVCARWGISICTARMAGSGMR